MKSNSLLISRQAKNSTLLKLCSVSAFTAISLLGTSVAAAQDCSNLPSWQPNETYVAGDQVKHNQKSYQSNWWNQGRNPQQYSNDYQEWTFLANCSGSSDNSPPSVSWLAPADQSTFNAGDLVTLQIQAEDADGQVSVVTVRANGDVVGQDALSPFEIPWTVTGGEYSLVAYAQDNDGATAESTPINITVNGTTGHVMTRSELEAKEAELTSTPLMQAVKQSVATLDNDLVEAVAVGSPNNPDNVRRVESILNGEQFEFLFSKRAPEYSYLKFLQAVAKFPAFCGGSHADSEAHCRKSLATMFAHFTQETGGHTDHWDVPQWRQGLVHVREMGWDETMRGGYNAECSPDLWQGQVWPCGKFPNGDFKSYFGRGAKQLSYNYNYGPFSHAMFGDVSVLLNNPEKVADTWLNLASAVFFFVYPQPPKPSMLHIIDGTWQPNDHDRQGGKVPGFGVTTMVINGGVECGGSEEHRQSQNRIDYYRDFANYLNVPIETDEVMGCANMARFDTQGSGALDINWEQDWGWYPENPDGKSYACKLVGYQTRFSAFNPGDYEKCVDHFFDVTIVDR